MDYIELNYFLAKCAEFYDNVIWGVGIPKDIFIFWVMVLDYVLRKISAENSNDRSQITTAQYDMNWLVDELTKNRKKLFAYLDLWEIFSDYIMWLKSSYKLDKNLFIRDNTKKMSKSEFLERCKTWFLQKDSMDYGRKWVETEIFILFKFSFNYIKKLLLQDKKENINKVWNKIKEISKWKSHIWFKNMYNALELSHCLNHPCTLCATDTNTWFARYSFCPHKDSNF